MLHFPFELPPDRIARVPSDRRDEAKLMVLKAPRFLPEHQQVLDIAKQFRAGDVMVLNEAKVDPVLFEWEHKGLQELLLLRCISEGAKTSDWEAIVSGKKLQIEKPYLVQDQVTFTLLGERSENSVARIRINQSKDQVYVFASHFGRVPLPPYIRKARRRAGMPEWTTQDEQRYQSTFASRPGAVAAPTAGLHLTQDLLQTLQAQGVEIVRVYLAVGWGTFGPVTPQQWKDRRLHEEYLEVSPQSAQALLQAHEEGRRVIAVGTTSVRTLETWWRRGHSPEGFQGNTDLFLAPPWSSELISGLMTNFHLPDSSLIALVAGFLGEGGVDVLLHAYQQALAHDYRFYSYGDAMFIQGRP